MKKRLISALISTALVLSSALAVFATTTPKVVLDDRVVTFVDQQPVILEEEGRTMVPVRGVFEAMGAKVEWDDSTKTATMNSEDGKTRVILTIGNEKMQVIKFTSVVSANVNEVTLDAPPRIMNDRTMVPLRAISEALNADVKWDAENYKVIITTKNADPASTTGNGTDPVVVVDTRIKASLSVDKTTVKTGETVTVSLNLSDISDKNYTFEGMTAGIYYDNTKFKYVSYETVINGVKLEDTIAGANAKYNNDSVKLAVIATEDTEAIKDGTIVKLTFEALSDESSSFTLSDRYFTDRGADTMFAFEKDGKSVEISKAVDLLIDTTPVEINK